MWKLDAQGNFVKDGNGNPVWINDGKESGITGALIPGLMSEAKNNRERAEKAEADLKAFEGLDPKAARDAVTKLSKIDQNQLIAADKLPEAIEQAIAPLRVENEKLKETNGSLIKNNEKLHLNTALASSDYIKNNLTIPPDMFMATFGDRFKVDGETIKSHGADGGPILSLKNPGKYADFNEAVEIIVSQYPHKDNIMKAKTNSGTGNQGNGAKNNGTGAAKTRADFAALPPTDQSAFMKEVKAGNASLID